MHYRNILLMAALLISMCISILNAETKNDLKNYEFIDHKNKSFHLSDLKGKPVFISFTFTDCIMFCPFQTSSLQTLRKKLLNEYDKSAFEFLSITLTPEENSYKDMFNFAKRFSAENYSNWRFATGHKEDIASLMKTLGVKIHKGSEKGQLNHTTTVYMLNKEGQLAEEIIGTPLDSNKILAAIKLENSINVQ